MLRRVPRLLRRAFLLASLVAVVVAVYQSWEAATPGAGGYVQTAWGPLGPADRDLLVRIRTAGLWEGPTGQQAQQMATSPEVKEVAEKISTEHHELDTRVREVANQLGVPLPSAPTAQQMAWMKEITQQTGSAYDRTFIQRLREAHGAVLPIINEVRAGTRNELIRSFATEADAYVSRHIEYLESTGLVDWAALPEPPSPGLLSADRQPGDLVLPAVALGAVLAAVIALIAGLRRREAERRAALRRRSAATRVVGAPATAIPAPRSAESSGRHALRR